MYPTSVFTSPQPERKESTASFDVFSGNRVIKLITPPMASDPYNVDAGPLMTSTRSISDCGIPDNPYTVDNPLTIGKPSIRIIV